MFVLVKLEYILFNKNKTKTTSSRNGWSSGRPRQWRRRRRRRRNCRLYNYKCNEYLFLLTDLPLESSSWLKTEGWFGCCFFQVGHFLQSHDNTAFQYLKKRNLPTVRTWGPHGCIGGSLKCFQWQLAWQIYRRYIKVNSCCLPLVSHSNLY